MEGTPAPATPSATLSPYSGLDDQDFNYNPPLVRTLRIAEEELRVTIDSINKLRQGDTDKFEALRLDFHEKEVECARHTSEYEGKLTNLESRLEEGANRSQSALFTSWVGAAMVAIGVNLVTSNDAGTIGVVLIVAGAAVELLAYLIRPKA